MALMCLAPPLALQAQHDWSIAPWMRASQQPVIEPDSNSQFKDPLTGDSVRWEALHTFNPAAIVRDGKVIVLYRAEDGTGQMAIGGHTSRLGMAVSDDGIHFTRMPEPVFYPAPDAQQQRESPGGVEDPRLVETQDGRYILTYTQWSRTARVYTIGVASSRDLQHWTKFGPIFGTTGPYASLKYKSAGIVTRVSGGRLIAAKIHGRYWMYWGEVEIHLATSSDLVHWRPIEDAPGVPKVVLRKRPGKSDSAFPETGPPAVLTPRGIVLLYNTKNAADDSRDMHVGADAYAVQEALFDKRSPARLLDQTDQPVLQPMLNWEKSGQYPAGTTFAEGLVLFQGNWWLYYGSADSFVGVAKVPFHKRDGNL
jgi:predicted GH43/DUF377 family glycosyl hydrolase